MKTNHPYLISFNHVGASRCDYTLSFNEGKTLSELTSQIVEHITNLSDKRRAILIKEQNLFFEMIRHLLQHLLSQSEGQEVALSEAFQKDGKDIPVESTLEAMGKLIQGKVLVKPMWSDEAIENELGYILQKHLVGVKHSESLFVPIQLDCTKSIEEMKESHPHVYAVAKDAGIVSYFLEETLPVGFVIGRLTKQLEVAEQTV